MCRGALQPDAFSWGQVDELLYRVDPSSRLFQLFQDGEVPSDAFVDRAPSGGAKPRLNKVRFYDFMSRGATVVMNRLDEDSLPAKRLCAEVSRFAGAPSSGNAYLSFGGNGTFGAHWDTHDVFAIQLLGKKRWQVFEPTLPLPLSHQTSRAHQGRCPKQPVLDIELCAGDMLYIPRGWWHRVMPCNVGSFHLSVGTYPATSLDYLQWISEQRLTSLAEMRASAERKPDMSSAVKALETSLDDERLLSAYEQSLRERERSSSEFNLALLLDSQRSDLAPETRVCLNSCYVHARNVESILAGDRLQMNGHPVSIDLLRKSLIRLLAVTTTSTLGALYEAMPTTPRSTISTALLDLARHDIVNVWR